MAKITEVRKAREAPAAKIADIPTRAQSSNERGTEGESDPSEVPLARAIAQEINLKMYRPNRR